MNILTKKYHLCIFFTFILFACNKTESRKKKTTDIEIDAKEVLINFVDINRHDMIKEGYADFRVFTRNNTTINTQIVEDKDNRIMYLAFRPIISHTPKEEKIITEDFKIYYKNKVITIVRSTFRLNSIQSTPYRKLLYYTNIENTNSNKTIKSPIRLLVNKGGRAYREEEEAKLFVIFNFPHVNMPETAPIDYKATIRSFMGQSVFPRQRGIFVTGNFQDSTQNVALAIEGLIHNYYDEKGILQEPYEIVYEITSQLLFENSTKHILKISNSGDCYNYKILACNFDGQPLQLKDVVHKASLGNEYILLTIDNNPPKPHYK